MATSEYPIIHGQGNWGSLTDGPAADRYTEAKISNLGMKMLECMDVADYIPNYTGEFKEYRKAVKCEPDVLYCFKLDM